MSGVTTTAVTTGAGVTAPVTTTTTTPTVIVETGVDRLVALALIGVLACACLFLLLAAFAANLAAPGQAGPLAIAAASSSGTQRFLLGVIARDTAAVGWYITNLVRGAEVLSTIIAALMVFLIIRARQGDALMTLLGLVVIAALIVPTNELIRLTESARGGKETARDIPRASTVTVASPDASVLIAQRVIQDLQFESLIETEARPGRPDRLVVPDARRFRDALGVALYRVEIGSIANTVRQRNLDRLLLELTIPESRTNLLLSPSTGRNAREDIALLRDLGVVSHLYGSMAQLEVSELGLRVLHRLYPENQNVRNLAEARRTQLFSPGERVSDQAAVVRAAVPLTPPITLASRIAADVRAPGSLPWNQQLQISQGLGTGVRLVVENETELVIEARGEGGFDPMIRVWNMEGGQPRGLVIEIDDWGNTNDARLLQTFAQGTYLVQILGFSGGSGATRAIIRSAIDRDRTSSTWTTSRDTLTAGTEELPWPSPNLDIQVAIPANGHAGRRLNVPERATIRMRTRSSDRADPMLELWRLGDSEGVLEVSDDDGAGGLDALIERSLAPGDYLLRLRERSGRPVEVTLTVERIFSPSPASAPLSTR